MALTNRKTTIYSPLPDGRRYVLIRPKGPLNDYHLHLFILESFIPEDHKLVTQRRSKLITINLPEVLQMIKPEQPETNASDSELDKLIDRLLERKLCLLNKDSTKYINFFESIEVGKSGVKFLINYQIIDFLLWVQNYWGKDNLARVNFSATHSFTSVYSEIIYNKIITTPTNYFEITVDDFRYELLATAPSYTDIRNLKQKVISPIIRDINKFTEYTLTVKQRYQGKVTTYLLFSWTKS